MATKTYLFLPENNGGLKQGYCMKDADGKVVYQGKMLKQSLFGPAQFEFVNHISGKTEEHKVGKTLTSSTEGAGVLDVLTQKSSFKFDGEKIWDYLHGKGFRFDSHLSGGKLGMTYNVTLKGQPFATLSSTTPGGKSMLTSAHCYDVTVDETDLDMAFLVTFAVARTDQTFVS